LKPYQDTDNVASVSETPSPRPAGGGGKSMLVNRFISQTNGVEKLLIYPSSVKGLRKKYGQKKPEIIPVRSAISGFSEKSKRNLRFLAGNTSRPLISQFCLTYHKTTPNGVTVKKHLNTWLTRLRQRFPEVAYLWVLEFQSRGVPHFHVWLSLPHDLPGLRNILAVSWNKIAEPDNETHLAFHKHKSNFIAWEMYNASYACKYLDKECQKHVPTGFVGVGRFWGNSRGLLAIPEEITSDDLEHLIPSTVDEETGEVHDHDAYSWVIRQLGKLHEKKLKGTPWNSRVRNGLASFTLHTSAPQLRKLLDYLHRQFESDTGLPF
jgi:hypothetical protein